MCISEIHYDMMILQSVLIFTGRFTCVVILSMFFQVSYEWDQLRSVHMNTKVIFTVASKKLGRLGTRLYMPTMCTVVKLKLHVGRDTI